MSNTRYCAVLAAASLLTWVIWSQSVAAGVPTTSTETASRTVEDGGTGPHKTLMVSDKTLATHTVFRPNDLSAFGEKVKLPIVAANP